MNEQIKALAVEAEFMLCEDGHFYSEGQSQKITDQLEKFSELIIMECISACIADIADPRDTVELKCAKKIKEHFGVKS